MDCHKSTPERSGGRAPALQKNFVFAGAGDRHERALGKAPKCLAKVFEKSFQKPLDISVMMCYLIDTNYNTS